MKSFLTGTKTPISIFSVSVKPSESVGSAVVVPLGSKVVLPNVVETRYPQTVRSSNVQWEKNKAEYSVVCGYLVEANDVVAPVLSEVVISLNLELI